MLVTTITIIALNCWGASGIQNPLLEGQKFSPVREHSIIITSSGFVPKHLSLFEGETLRIFLTTTEERQGCLIIPALDIFLGTSPGKVSSTEVTFTSAGRYDYYCLEDKREEGDSGSESEKRLTGTITVLRPNHKKERFPSSSFSPHRAPASESLSFGEEQDAWARDSWNDPWMPREF